jgi:hypothetical protein
MRFWRATNQDPRAAWDEGGAPMSDGDRILVDADLLDPLNPGSYPRHPCRNSALPKNLPSSVFEFFQQNRPEAD